MFSISLQPLQLHRELTRICWGDWNSLNKNLLVVATLINITPYWNLAPIISLNSCLDMFPAIYWHRMMMRFKRNEFDFNCISCTPTANFMVLKDNKQLESWQSDIKGRYNEVLKLIKLTWFFLIRTWNDGWTEAENAFLSTGRSIYCSSSCRNAILIKCEHSSLWFPAFVAKKRQLPIMAVDRIKVIHFSISRIYLGACTRSSSPTSDHK